MNVGDAEIGKIVYACGVYAVVVYCGACVGEGKELALVCHAGV